LPVAEELKAKMAEADAKGLRLCKVSIEGKPPKLVLADTMVAGDSFTADWDEMLKSKELLLEDVGCFLLIRLFDKQGTVPGASEEDWVVLSWTPEAVPVRQKMLYTASCKTLKDSFESLRWKEMKATDRDDVSLKEIMQKARVLHRGLTKEERHEVMSHQEILLEEVKEDFAKAATNAPKMMAGMVALQIKALASFDEAMEKLAQQKGKVAVVAKLEGAKREEVSGELLSDAGRPSQLKGRLPTNEPCYVILQPDERRLVLISWLPEDVPAKIKMTASTFKRSVVQMLEQRLPEGGKLRKVEVTEEDDLTDDILDEPVQEEAAAEAAAAPAPKKAFKPPVGGFALPGLGPPRG